MTDTEIKTALIHIKRHIYSKPIKAYISTLLRDLDKQTTTIPEAYRKPLYGQKKGLKIDDNI